MTVNEAIFAVQGKRAGFINRQSGKYAQTLLLPQETVIAAVVANIRTRRDKYPGVVVITDRRVLAACGMPGIRRSTALQISDLEKCEQTSSAIQFKATFLTRKDAFTMVVDPDVGTAFSKYIDQMNNEQFEDVKISVDGSILNPNWMRARARNKQRSHKTQAHAVAQDVALQKAAAARFHAAEEQHET